MSEPVQLEVVGSVARITLDRPDVRNALDAASIRLLRQAFSRAADDPRVRAVVLTGSGTVFCSGADLAQGAAADDEVFSAGGPAALAEVLEQMISLRKPVIARVQGHVAGGGVGLVAASDLAVAVDAATFAFSEVRVGVAPAVISVAVLRKMRAADAAELMLTGARVPAERVRAAGLVQRVVADVDLDDTVARWVADLDRCGPRAVAATKELLARVPTMPRDDAWPWTAQMSQTLFGSPEAAEGMAAFLERRPADWSGT
jgi:methylglutaconyl-CoA hydratase